MRKRAEKFVVFVDLASEQPHAVTSDGRRYDVTRERAMRLAVNIVRQNENSP